MKGSAGTHGTLVMTHVNVTLEVKSWTSREAEGFEVGVQGDLVPVIRVVGPSERTDQLFVRDTSVTKERKGSAGEKESSLVASICCQLF